MYSRLVVESLLLHSDVYYVMIFEKLVFTMGIICLMYPQFSTLMVKYEISFVLKRFLEESYCLYKLFEEALNTHALIAHRR